MSNQALIQGTLKRLKDTKADEREAALNLFSRVSGIGYLVSGHVKLGPWRHNNLWIAGF
jgi:hypothetical protein